METPEKISHDPNHFFWVIFDFIVRNAFGLLTFLAGFVYQVYQMSGRSRVLTKAQCILAVILWLVSGVAVVVALTNVEMNKLIYGVVCWATPIVIKPFADKLAEHAPNVAEKLLVWIELLIDKKTKEKK
jgi:hypothetical protein